MSIMSDVEDAVASARVASVRAPQKETPEGISQTETSIGMSIGTTPAQTNPQSVSLDGSLAALTEHRGGAFNWQESIVDLMKLLRVDSSLHSLQQLARELGYPGDPDGSPETTDWLHSAVMTRLHARFDVA